MLRRSQQFHRFSVLGSFIGADVYNGHFTNAWYLSDLYRWLLDQVITDNPDKAEAIACAMSRHGHIETIWRRRLSIYSSARHKAG